MAEPIRPEALSLFVGTWKTTGTTRATADAPSERIEAIDRYEWMAGGFFLLHHVDSLLPDAFKALEIIGHDHAGGGYLLSSFDSNGRTVASTGELKGRELQIVTPTERFAGAFSEDGQTLSGTWERLEGGGQRWRPSMDITLRKIGEP